VVKAFIFIHLTKGLGWNRFHFSHEIGLTWAVLDQFNFLDLYLLRNELVKVFVDFDNWQTANTFDCSFIFSLFKFFIFIVILILWIILLIRGILVDVHPHLSDLLVVCILLAIRHVVGLSILTDVDTGNFWLRLRDILKVVVRIDWFQCAAQHELVAIDVITAQPL
jgi:hypothetical protein